MLAGSTSRPPAGPPVLLSFGRAGQSDLRRLYIRGVYEAAAAVPERSPWLTPLRRGQPAAEAGLICFPYGGASAAVFHGWGERLPAAVDVHAVQLPGRTARLFEPPFTSLPALVEALAEALAPALARPTVMFGHSIGALLAFELTRELRRRRGRAPAALFLSACPAPHIPIRTRLHELPEPDLIAQLAALGGTPAELLADRGLLDLVLPAVRADFELAETYSYAPEPPLELPIAAFAGRGDEHAGVDAVGAWREHTTAAFTLDVLGGGHFFIHAEAERLLDLICRRLAEVLP
jgi:surfactin synthase thioesterase subunit